MQEASESSDNPRSEGISEYERERRAKLQKLRELGVDPYGQRTDGIRPLAQIKASYRPEMGHDSGPVVKGAGRIMLKRDMGKLSFLTLRDESGDLQVALDRKRLDDRAWQVRNLLDLGDQIVVEGPLGATNRGEITIWATALMLGAKALLPPPAKWQGLENLELRYRQRYVDLWANPEVMRTMKLRIRVVEEIRNFLRGRGFEEVETPMMQPLHGGAAARPFVTHHNALDIDLYLRIAPELYLKRLLVGGFSRIFELNRNFRNEGISPRHNPEFTMLEAYEAYGSWETMAELVESMICHIAQSVFGTLRIRHPSGREINLEGDTSKPPGYRWRRVRMVDLVEERTGWRFDKRPLQQVKPELIEQFRHKGQKATFDVGARPVPTSPAPKDMPILGYTPAEQLVEVYEKLIEPTLIDPTFVTHVPSVIIPLARENQEDPYFADVYELAINGVEISPGYSELNDPDKQREHFAHQVGEKEEQHRVDEDFLTALKYGMPPAGGMGLGVDRLMMMFTGAQSIRDVILFPLMRPDGRDP
ncbi:lysine--tRNA ligase [Fontivita pretiosa]|uniref:lysine--tRNA ligase n=1 Tax=Fontivita pretiosa TaxID=2989684 RepID=UPI003D171524